MIEVPAGDAADARIWAVVVVYPLPVRGVILRLLDAFDDVLIQTPDDAKIKISMDSRGRYLDNIFIERLWRSLKQEAVYLHELHDGFQAKRIIDT